MSEPIGPGPVLPVEAIVDLIDRMGAAGRLTGNNIRLMALFFEWGLDHEVLGLPDGEVLFAEAPEIEAPRPEIVVSVTPPPDGPPKPAPGGAAALAQEVAAFWQAKAARAESQHTSAAGAGEHPPAEVGGETGGKEPPAAAGDKGAPAAHKPRSPQANAWTQAEDETILRLRQQGKTLSEIADHLPNRTKSAVQQRISKALRDRCPEAGRGPKAKAAKAEPAVRPKDREPVRRPAPPPEPRPLESPEPYRPEPYRPARPFDMGIRREMEAWLHALPEDPAWPPARDLELVEAIVGGEGAGGAAARLDITKDEAIGRWRMLLPEPSIDGQTALLEVLRAKVKEAA